MMEREIVNCGGSTPHPRCNCQRCACAERDRLQRILDSRPAINAGLPQTYIEWSQKIYTADFAVYRGYHS